MDGKAKAVVGEVLSAPKLVIPVYQRRYSWAKPQVNRMMSDIGNAIRSRRNNYFLGSVILDSTQGDYSEVAVIDGQQRLITLSLLLMGLQELLTESDPKIAEKIKNVYLIDPYAQDGLLRNRLQPIEDDQEKYLDVYEHGYDAKPSLFLENFLEMTSYIARSSVTPKEWFDYIERRVMVMAITAQPGDDAQLIFESLNSTGLDLTEADKIRNYLLMSLPPSHQQSAFKIWQENEALVHRDKMSTFYRHFLSSLEKTSKPIKQPDVYEQYRRLVGSAKGFEREHQLSVETVIANRFAMIDHPQTANIQNDQIRQLLIRLSHLNTDVYMPFVLTLFNKQAQKTISEDELRDSLKLLLSYLARRLAVGIATAGLSNFFVALNRQVNNVQRSFETYSDALSYVLVKNSQFNKVFPSNEQLLEAFQTRDYYQHAKAGLWFILDELNRAQGEDQDLYGKAESGTFSIEHIMPQTLSKLWRDSLGERANDIHDHWVDRLANLTLTGFNSKMSNRPFTEKRDMKDGYRDTAIKLNFWLTSFDHWDEKTLRERQDDLYERALQVWPMPKVDTIVIDSNQHDQIELSEGLDITGWKIDAFSFLETFEEPVKSWQELSERITNLLWDEDPTRLYQAASDPNDNLVIYAKDPAISDKYLPLPDPSIQILCRGINNQWRLKLLQRLLGYYQYSLSDVTVHQTNQDRLPFSGQQRAFIGDQLRELLPKLESSYPITMVSTSGGSTYARFRTKKIDDYFNDVFQFAKGDTRAWSNGSPYYWEFQLKDKSGIVLRLVTHWSTDDRAILEAINNVLQDYDTQPITHKDGWRTVRHTWSLNIRPEDIDLSTPRASVDAIETALRSLISGI